MNKCGSGLAVTATLTLIFLLLKLHGVYDWSWSTLIAPIMLGVAGELVNLAMCRLCIAQKGRKAK